MKTIRASRQKHALRGLWLIEMAVVVLSVLGAARLRYLNDLSAFDSFVGGILPRALLVALCVTGSMLAFGLYQAYVRHRKIDFLLRLSVSFMFGGVALLVIYYAVPQTYIGRGVLALALSIGFCAILLVRLLVLHLSAATMLKQRVLIYGAGEKANLINTRLRRKSDRQSFNILGFVPVPNQPIVVDDELLINSGETISQIAERMDVDEIVIAPDERRGGMPMEQMLVCVQQGVLVTDLSSFFEREAGMVQLSIADPSWLVFSGEFDYSTPRRLTKRFFDLLAAIALLVVSWPAMLLVALAVRLESPGPVLYRQTRVGEHGRHFEMVKFRSMRVDAESDGKAVWAQQNDDRTTRVGKFIRKTRLDELPQLFLVLKGEMSFVGPRPERPQFVEMLNNEVRYYGVRHSVKPGLTGWAQLRYPYGASVRDANEKLKFDLFYVKNHGLLFDLMIMLQTVEVVLFGRGAR
ncbi:MAG: TIGR03013 family PEP-CTERM/XrtA system glycosyltransferase [Lysobacteraceae bacterium]|nr:MAG: TIGR03013 family PEP-CTERM/XrtA system glycosyltransferase [Xanthomonadaceae bacterium]